MLNIFKAAMFAIVTIAVSYPALSAPVFSIGAGSAVASIDRSVTFDPINANGLSLSGYIEDGLVIDVNDTSEVGFEPFSAGGATTGFFYGIQGNSSFVEITASDAAVFRAVEFRLGSGTNLGALLKLRWETLLSGSSTGTALETNLNHDLIVGIGDVFGFDTLRIAVFAQNPGPTSPFGGSNFGDPQTAAIDDLNAQTVPLPPALLMMVAGIVSAVAISTRRRR